MASQNLPGVAAIRAAGYHDADLEDHHADRRGDAAARALRRLRAEPRRPSPRRSAWAARRTRTRPSATPRPWPAALIYIVIGLFGAAVTGVLTAFPRELVVAVAGLALLGSIGGGLAVALKDEPHREAALITFLVTLSGVSLCGHRLGVLGRGGRGLDLGCAVLAAARLDSDHARLPLARVPARPRPPHAGVLRRPLHRSDAAASSTSSRTTARSTTGARATSSAARASCSTTRWRSAVSARPSSQAAVRHGLAFLQRRTPSRRAATPGRSTGHGAAAPRCRTAPTTATAWPSCCWPMRTR